MNKIVDKMLDIGLGLSQSYQLCNNNVNLYNYAYNCSYE